MSIRVQMDVTEGEKQMILALRRAALTVTPYNGSAALQALMTGGQPDVQAVRTGRCKAEGRGDLQCVKDSGHGQRHRYGPKSANPAVHRVPEREWVKQTGFRQQSGTKHFLIEVGYPCKVEGQRGLWKVIGVEIHKSTGKINVEVTNDRTGHSRVFPSDKIVYKRPRKVSA